MMDPKLYQRADESWLESVSRYLETGIPDVPIKSVIPAAGALGLLAAPEDAEAGFVNRGGRTLLEAFHGSPHHFDRFDMSKIGTGEGAQAYGHGLYFSDSEDVARRYRDNLAPTRQSDGNAEIMELLADADTDDFPEEQIVDTLINRFKAGESIDDLAKNLDGDYGYWAKKLASSDPGTRSYFENTVNGIGGALYRTEIDVAPESLLDWDKPLSEQSEAVRNAVDSLDPATRGFYKYDGEERTGRDFYWGLKADMTRSEAESLGISREGWLLENDERASKMLRDRGIKGIKYLDGDSRSAGEGTRNYVMFDDGLINIAERGFADPRLIAGTAGGGLLATEIAPEVKALLEEAGVIGGSNPHRKPLGERAMGLLDRILTGLEVPQRGVQGLAATGYGLLSGEDFDVAASRGADVVRQGVDASARQFGDYIFDLTGSPEAATAAYTSGILGSPL